MMTRFTLSLGAALLISGAAVACTTTVIEQRTAPPVTDDGGLDAPVIEEPVADGGTDADTTFVFKPAPKGTFAQAVSAGGSVVKAPKMVPIVYNADSQKQTIVDFSAKMGTTAYWGQISSEYGIGALTSKTPIILTETAPSTIDNDQIETWLANKFSSDPTRFGTPDSNTLYAIYYPAGTTVTQGGGAGCTDFGGYHFETTAGGVPISYAVMPRCAAFAGLGGSDVTTFAASHEILEWASDPFPATRPAYMAVDDEHAVWSRVFLGELGDLCTQLGDVSIVPADLGFKVQRTWSNESAAAGHHPCAPTAKSGYFTAFPAKPDLIAVTDEFGRKISTQGFKVAVGQSKTIDLTVYADSDVGSFDVQVLDITKIYGISPEFSYTLNRTKARAGDTLHLTITGEQAATQGQGFLILTQSKNSENIFPVWVTN